jgi:hypothetical protein
MCVFHDPAAPQQCREPVAEPVADRQRANFCGYFQVNPQAPAAAPDPAATTRELAALFGEESAAGSGEAAAREDALRAQLEQLFRK